MTERKRVLKPDGGPLFVTPVGRPRFEFNAHRVYSYEEIIQAFAGLSLRQFALVDDKTNLPWTPAPNPPVSKITAVGAGGL